ncbi:MAG: hypothetical protein IJY09_04515 [Lachnospiraceae bacterium]|nr:hypothetical protein [Lachnospiraceae bacterium]
MIKKFCPYCDHEIGGARKCPYCNSRVRKPVLVETSAEYSTSASAMPGDCDCNIHSPQLHPHDDAYRDSTDASFERDYKEAYQSDRSSMRAAASRASNRLNPATTKGQPKKNNAAKTVVIVYIIIFVLMQLMRILMALD